MALAIEWAKPLDRETVEDAAKIARTDKEIATFFPTERTFPSFEIRVAEDGASVDKKGLNVSDFLKTDAGGRQEWALSLRPEFFSCNCTVYDRWVNVKPRAVSFLKRIAAGALNRGNVIQAIGLQYSDVFRWGSDDAEAMQELLRHDSPLLPQSIFTHKSLWHTHNGWFSAAPDGHRMLNTLNIDLTIESHEQVIRINGQHRMQAVAFDDASSQNLAIDELDIIADHLHMSNKLVLQNLLSDSALQLINMGKVSPN
jgi:uncharacterized protein (TIGR04255 family)